MNMSSELYGSNNTLEFCRGHTKIVAHTVLMFEGIPASQLSDGQFMLNLVLLSAQTLIILELACYIYLFLFLKKQNQSLIKVLQEDILRKRSKKNTITLIGSSITFAIELFYANLMPILINFGKIAGFFEPAAIPCALICIMALTTMTQILTSPELRKYCVEEKFKLWIQYLRPRRVRHNASPFDLLALGTHWRWTSRSNNVKLNQVQPITT